MQFKTTRTGREYSLKFSKPSLYGGTYLLSKYVEDTLARVCKALGIDQYPEDRDCNGLDHDAEEITAIALLYLTKHNINLTSIDGKEII